MYRCWGAGQGDENRCDLRKTVPGLECCLLVLSKEAGHSVTSTERVEKQVHCSHQGNWQSHELERSADWYQCQMQPIVGCSLVFAPAASALARQPVRERQCQRNRQGF